MLPDPCSQCGAPLPAVATDRTHPDRCPACAARAVGVAGPTVVPAPPQASGRSDQYGADAWVHGGVGPAPVVAETRVFDGLLTGLAAASLAGAIWWGVTTLTSRQFAYLALLVGLLVGQGVLEGARKGGVVPGLVAGVLCLLALVVAQYFIQRSLVLAEAADAGVTLDLPLWQGFGYAKDTILDGVSIQGTRVSDGVRDDPLRGAFWVGAAIVAAVVAGKPSGRATIG